MLSEGTCVTFDRMRSFMSHTSSMVRITVRWLKKEPVSTAVFSCLHCMLSSMTLARSEHITYTSVAAMSSLLYVPTITPSHMHSHKLHFVVLIKISTSKIWTLQWLKNKQWPVSIYLEKTSFTFFSDNIAYWIKKYFYNNPEMLSISCAHRAL